MEPILDEQQSLMRETAVRLCKDHGGPKRARALRNAGTEMDVPAWMELVRSGWICAAVSEEAGGMGWACWMSAWRWRRRASNC